MDSRCITSMVGRVCSLGILGPNVVDCSYVAFARARFYRCRSTVVYCKETCPSTFVSYYQP